MNDITGFNRILLLLRLEVTVSGFKHSRGAVMEYKKGTLFNSLKDSSSKGDHYCFLILKTNKKRKPKIWQMLHVMRDVLAAYFSSSDSGALLNPITEIYFLVF